MVRPVLVHGNDVPLAHHAAKEVRVPQRGAQGPQTRAVPGAQKYETNAFGDLVTTVLGRLFEQI